MSKHKENPGVSVELVCMADIAMEPSPRRPGWFWPVRANGSPLARTRVPISVAKSSKSSKSSSLRR